MIHRQAARGALLLALSSIVTTAVAVTAGSTTYTYDGLGRIIAVVNQDTTGQIYRYDPAGNRITSYSGNPTILTVGNSAPSVTEGGTLTVTVTESGTAATTSLSYQTVNGTAVSGTNYTATSGTLNFSASQTSQSFNVVTTNDSKYDGPLTFSIKLTPTAANAVVAPSGNVVVTINEANAAPTFSISSAGSATEGSDVSFTVTRTNATSLSNVVSYTTADGIAITGVDYAKTIGTLSFAPTDTSKTITVPTYHRSLYEANRTFTASLSNPTNGATITTASATGTITDADTASTFAINSPAAVNEGNPITFTVTKAGGPAGITFTLNYASASGTATSGSDFTAVSGTICFPYNNGVCPNGSIVSTGSTPITVATIDSHSDTTARTFTVNLSGATNSAPIGTPTGTGTIQSTNVPAAPTLSPSYQYSTSGAFNFSWNNPGGNPTSYQLWMTSPTNTQVYSGTATTFSGSKGVSNDYYYEVRACNANGCGAFSNQADVTVDKTCQTC